VDSGSCGGQRRRKDSLVLASAWDAAIMLQEFLPEHLPNQTLGTGTSVCFMCEDALALYREFKSHGIQTRKRPFVGNRLWVVPLTDPDGYRIDFESPADASEESEFEE